jgi:hypothetical protein
MITCREHSIASAACHISLVGRLPHRGHAGRCFAALIILLFIVSATALAAPHRGKHIGKRKAAERSRRAHAKETKPDAKVPISVNRLDTPDGSGIIAIFGAFPSDLVDETGQAYLEREFFEHVVAAVLLLDDSPDSETYPMIEVAMLPQEKNQREGDFTFGKVKGHIIVVVEKRRVIVKCIFKEAQPQQIFAGTALVERLPAG